MKELILHVAKESHDDPSFGAVKLNKILFYADFMSYLRRGKSITDQEYFALKEGPGPRRFVPIRKDMEKDGEIAIQQVTLGLSLKPQQRVIPLRDPDYSRLEAEDIVVADDVVRLLRGKNGRQVSDMSHEFAGWIAAFAKGEGTSIPYSTVRFDPAGFMGFDTPSLPAEIVKYAKELDAELDRAA
jgi:hypothetical protein